MKNNVYLFQPNYKGGMGKFTSHWLPTSIATVWAYVSKFEHIRDNFEVKKTFFSRPAKESVLRDVVNPKVCMFSTYIWNENYNLTMAEAIKSIYPDCVIAFGGPQVNNDGFSFLEKHPFIDTIVLNEGEHGALELLEDSLQGAVKRVYKKGRMNELGEVPSPYTDTDIMDKIVKENNSKWSATLETNRGCPFKCSFCDWGGLTYSKVKKFNLERVFADIDWMVDNKVEQIIMADANFGMFYERDKMIAQYIIDAKKRTGFPLTVGMSHYKNSTEKVVEIVAMLSDAGLNRGMSLSVQSLDDAVLENIERKNMEINQLSYIYNLCNKNNISYYTEFIMCLPKETKDSWVDGICKALDAGCHGYLELYPLEILRNSSMTAQIPEHGFEVFNYDVLEKGQESEIPEKHNYVISSKYMPREDYIEAWMRGWVIVNFHTFGWTQIITRFATKHLGISYRALYNNLYDYVLNNKTLKPIHDEYKAGFVNFFYNDPNNTGVFARANDITPDAIQYKFHEQRAIVVEEIKKWASEILKDVPDELFLDILRMQDLFVVDYLDKEDSQVHKFSYNLLEYINNSEVVLEKNTQKYLFTNVMPWDDRVDFYAKIYMKIRDGFTKKKLSNVKSNSVKTIIHKKVKDEVL